MNIHSGNIHSGLVRDRSCSSSSDSDSDSMVVMKILTGRERNQEASWWSESWETSNQEPWPGAHPIQKSLWQASQGHSESGETHLQGCGRCRGCCLKLHECKIKLFPNMFMLWWWFSCITKFSLNHAYYSSDTGSSHSFLKYGHK